MDIDKKIIYQNLRNESMDLIKRQDTYLLASYTLCISVWTIAINMSSEWIALFPLIFLIPISLRICEFRHATVFLSAYMAVFLEEESYDGWEYVREEFFKAYPKQRKTFASYCSKLSFSVLALISSLVFWVIRNFDFRVFGHLWLGWFLVAIQIVIIILQGIIWWKNSDTTGMKLPLMTKWKKLYTKLYQDKEA